MLRIICKLGKGYSLGINPCVSGSNFNSVNGEYNPSRTCEGRFFHAGEVKKKFRLRNDEYAETISRDAKVYRVRDIFPDENLPNKIFNGILYKELPIVNIVVSPNNTIMNLTDYKGIPKIIRSCGVEGFRNTKKGTNLAAQATALTFSRKAVELGYKTVRVRIGGLGPGRNSSIRGLVSGGLEIVSVTDNTRVSDNPPRPKKLRRV